MEFQKKGAWANDALRMLLTGYLFLSAFRIALSCLIAIFGWQEYAMFGPRDDFFADSIKSGLAQTSISHCLLSDPSVRDWPQIFQRYLFHNDYLQPGWSIHHSPPFSMLMLMGFAAILLVVPPTILIVMLASVYAAGTALVARLARAASGQQLALPLFMLILLSFPSLFMLDRGNIHSGLTSLCVIFYVISAHKDRWKRPGWLALAVAINLRPNVAIFALLEFARTPDRRAAIMGIFTAAVLSLGIAGISYLIAHAIDATYTPKSFLAALDLYRLNYVEGRSGFLWNSSLANSGKTIRYFLDIEPFYSAPWTLASSILGLTAIAVLTMLAWFSRMGALGLTFSLAACSALFTPVLAEYHLLVFVSPLLLAVLSKPEAISTKILYRGLFYLGLLQFLCFLHWMGPHPILLGLMACVALAFPLIIARATRPDESTEAVLALVSLAALSPLGGMITQGYVVGLMVFATLVWLLWQGNTRRSGDPVTISR